MSQFYEEKLNTQVWTPGITVEFDNCHDIVPSSGKDTGLTKIFVVRDDGSLWPTPIASGKYRNCTELPKGIPWDHYVRMLKILAKYYKNTPAAYHCLMMGWPYEEDENGKNIHP